MKNKRGQMLLTRLIPLLILSLMALFIFFQIKALVTSPYAATSLFVAKDTALLVDTIDSIPVNIHYEYPTSLKGNFLKKQNNSLLIYNNIDEKSKISFKSYKINPSKYTKVISSPKLDLTFFAINKKDNNIILLDGLDSKMALTDENLSNSLKKSNFEKKQVKIYIENIGSEQEKEFLNFIKNSLIANLEQDNFNVTSKKKANMILSISSSDKEKTTVGYSTENSIETKPLAENIIKVLSQYPDINIEDNPEPMKTSEKPSIKIIIDKKTEKTLQNSDAEKRLFSNYISIAINQYYK